MTGFEVWCGVTGDDCYPTGTELRWAALFLLAVALICLCVAARQIWEDR